MDDTLVKAVKDKAMRNTLRKFMLFMIILWLMMQY